LYAFIFKIDGFTKNLALGDPVPAWFTYDLNTTYTIYTSNTLFAGNHTI